LKPSSLWIDLRERVVTAIAQGASCHGAAAHFGGQVSSTSRWAGRGRQDGQVAPRARGSDQRSQVIEANAALILSTDKTRPGIVLHALRDALASQGVATSRSGLSRLFARHRITRERGGPRG
jgi:transposase